MAFAISWEALKDLPRIKQTYPAPVEYTHVSDTLGYALWRQKSYTYKTFFTFPLAYHWIRGHMVYAPQQNNWDCAYPIPQEHADAFYQPENLFHTWRTLYNQFCEAMPSHLGLTEEQRHDRAVFWDQHFTRWSEKDEDPNVFRDYPDRLPS